MADTRNTVVTALLAFAGGFVAGVLLAPDSGAKTRERIASEARSRLHRLEGKLDSLQSQVSTLQDSLRSAGAEAQRRFRDAGVEVGDRVREAAHQAVDRVVPGVPDDPEAFRIENKDLAKDLRRMPRT